MFSDSLRRDAAKIGAHLETVLSAGPNLPVIEGMRYAVAGGKRLRGFLVMEGARLHGVPETQAIWPAAAIEAIHAYSLVHDDLPCMDDDDLRRGLPTVHRKWDDGTAVLVGDALQTLGFELTLDPACHPSAEVRADLALSLGRASGRDGMVLGQALDIAAESAEAPLTLDQITELQAGKTGALIVWSAEAGARLAQADLTPLTDYATALGLAFQIADDILDVEGDETTVGKAVGKDADRGKATFVSLLGLEGAKRRAAELVEAACEALSPYGDRAQTLNHAARFVISRDT
ncbi:polyprenyl synthetase family protein [Marivita sp. XM-24bin2]|jgi:farnesyl diphosphate synthase|uniref:polyprenyl synthetase family protein n=1 Tax=unclassified Marivita TaxID=2632480 RepID=UPI000D78DA2E|nr:farnesyl diphosphate synthase [Marivita sp. XM-24bin2]MCR9107671.1 polyprenyl synthetase family protein [Paracoccaceae bacterium]PWL35524.1 MAG: farnesyl-diphosphate synthase [Marivita sp. XM-24bin2]